MKEIARLIIVRHDISTLTWLISADVIYNFEFFHIIFKERLYN